MRLRNLILCLLFCISSASAKDIITKTDGTKLDAKVEEITETLIKYRKASNPTGPIYTIAIESVANIVFENGEVEKFNESTTLKDINFISRKGLSDDDLLMLELNQSEAESEPRISDSQLIMMNGIQGSMDVEDLQSKGDTYKKIAMIGSGTWVVCGIVASAILHSITDLSWYWGVTMPIGIGVGAIWYFTFNYKANLFYKQARQMQSYSTTIIENNFIKFGDNSLTAGINVMGNRMVNSHSLGLSLGLNF